MARTDGPEIVEAGERDLATVRALFADYAATLPIDLAFQGFAAELATLPGRYARPGGIVLLARSPEGGPLGCIALRPLPDRPGACEVKRLFVLPDARGTGTGRALVDAVLRFAVRAGYREALLDTLATMAGAIALYRSAGFEPTEPYGEATIAGQFYFRKTLSRRSSC